MQPTHIQTPDGQEGLVLRIVQSPGELGEICVSVRGAVIGRSKACDIVLDHQWVSRRHLQVRREADGWTVEDMGSKSGTRVDSVLVESGERGILWNGSMLEVGPWRMLVEQGAREPQEQVSASIADALSGETRVTLIHGIQDSSTGVRNAAWERFVARYGRVISGYARQFGVKGQEVDDVVQDVYLSLHKLKAGVKYDSTIGRFHSYMFVATRNAVRTRARGGSPKHQEPLLESAVEATAPDPYWDAQWAENMLIRGLEILQRTMSPIHYDAFERHGRRGERAVDVGGDLGLSPENVRQIKRRAMLQLRQIVLSLDTEGV